MSGYDGISIERRGNRWLYRAYDRQTGKRKSRTFQRNQDDEHRHNPGTAAGDRWAQDKRAEYQLRLDRAGVLPAKVVLADYLTALKDRRRVEHHRAEVERICKDMLARGEVTDLRADDLLVRIERWRRALRARSKSAEPRKEGDPRPARLTRKELSPVTVNRYTTIVRGMINFALERGYLYRDPLLPLRPVGEPDRIKPVFSVAEVRQFLLAKRTSDAAWWWVSIMLLTGCRCSEALHLCWEDMRDGVLVVQLRDGTDLKRKRERVVPIHPDLATVVSWHPKPKNAGPLVQESALRSADAKFYGERFREVLTAAGVTPGKRTPHCCRHTLAAMLTAGHASSFMVADWLGHSQLETTRGYSREAATLRPVIEAEGWKPGELRFLPR